MTPAERYAFLQLPLVANLATVKPDGSPHVTPVWHYYDGEKLYVVAEESAFKVRNARHEPRVSLSIATHSQPYKYVLVNGTAAVSHERIPELVRIMAVNYLGREEGEEYTDRVLKELSFCTITVTPTSVVDWEDED